MISPVVHDIGNVLNGPLRTLNAPNGPFSRGGAWRPVVQSARGTYANAHYHQIRGRRGPQKALGALRHDILIAYWHIVHDNVDYHDLGDDWFARRHTIDHQRHRLVRQLEHLGYTVTLEENNAALLSHPTPEVAE